MALKAELETLEGLPEPVAKEYKEVARGDKKVFILDLDGDDLPDEIPAKQALRKARDHERKGRSEAEKKAKDHETRIEQLQTEIDEMRRGNIPKADVDKLEGSWKEKLNKQKEGYESQIGARDKTLQNLLVDTVATRMAAEISVSGSADLILPHIKNRLTTELVDGQFVTRVLDKDGKPSALSIEELQKDITTDKRFAPIIKGSKASGGGASGGGGGEGSGAPPAFDPKKFNPNKATPAELVAWNKWKKEQREHNK